MKLQTNNIEAISGPNQFSPARFIQFRYFEKYYVVFHSALGGFNSVRNLGTGFKSDGLLCLYEDAFSLQRLN